jgi:hypothetical protein
VALRGGEEPLLGTMPRLLGWTGQGRDPPLSVDTNAVLVAGSKTRQAAGEGLAVAGAEDLARCQATTRGCSYTHLHVHPRDEECYCINEKCEAVWDGASKCRTFTYRSKSSYSWRNAT